MSLEYLNPKYATVPLLPEGIIPKSFTLPYFPIPIMFCDLPHM
jgi:hypothetical protein